MYIGVLQLELRLPGNDSLKGKRSVLRRILERTREKFHCAAAETGRNDEHEFAEIGFSVVGNDHAFVNGCLDKIANYVESLGLAQMASQEWDILRFP